MTSEAAQRINPWLEALWLLILGFAVIGFFYPTEPATRVLFGFYFLAWIMAFFLIHYDTRFRLGLIPFLLPYTALGVTGLVAYVRGYRAAQFRVA